jgi:hypothetical protein
MEKKASMSTARLVRILFAIGLLALAACATQKHSRDLLQISLYDYAGAVRWGNFNGAATFLDPEVLEKKPMTPLDLSRYEQVQIAGYTVIGSETPSEGVYLQSVELRLINRHTQAERTVVDRQRWRYDAELRRWWIVSGLPNITEMR